ncbi:hypothetical protein G7Y89_g11594 [Cudoniella acicularis]|uniref:Enoyl reductase (ER) domain-containing protein n=1 Tax=Cudoniella acicularis TaxID=354080 RepID=A0A8H4VXQ4_9HELO|nr:hypothetical protein G7Y89_g11594 [Cudoniella acicularis]
MPKAIIMRQIEGKPGKVYYPLELTTISDPTPGPNDLLITIQACALNHRDYFLRQHLYPAPSFTVPILADGCGLVTSSPSSSSTAKFFVGKRVLLTPGRGWKDSPHGPEAAGGYAILGGTKTFPLGTAQEVVSVHEDEVEECPEHLTNAQAAALPLTGLTAWRALVSKSGNAEAGRNILVTGIGGGVALNALQFGAALGINVFVTSGNQEKIDKAVGIGAKGGVSYKDEAWEKELKKILPKDRPYLDAIIDARRSNRPIWHDSRPQNGLDHVANLNNLELRGSTMGSRKEFKDMVAFVREKKIVPIVSRVVKGLENLKEIDGLFEDMRDGKQFGKLIIQVTSEDEGNGAGGKELERLAQNAAVANPSEPAQEEIGRWRHLFGYSHYESYQLLLAHRSDVTRTPISDSHWELVRSEREAAGHNRESYEHSLTLKDVLKSQSTVVYDKDGGKWVGGGSEGYGWGGGGEFGEG